MPERARAAAGRSLGALLLALLAVVAVATAAFGWWSWSSGAAMPRPVDERAERSAPPVLLPDDGPDLAVGSDHLSPAEVERTEAAAKGAIDGILLAATGEPLGGFAIELFRRGHGAEDASYFIRNRDNDPARALALAVSGRDGRFQLPVPAAGAYDLRLLSSKEQALEVDMAAGEVRQVEFRLSAPVLQATVTRHGQPVKRCRLTLVDEHGAERSSLAEDDEGYLAFVVSPGRYRLEVRSAFGVTRRQELVHERETWMLVHACPVDVPASAAFVRCDIALATTRVRFEVQDGTDEPLRGLLLQLRGRSDLQDQEWNLELRPNHTRGAVVDLPSGTWTVGARAPALVASQPVAFATSVTVPDLRVEIPVQPAATLQLVLRRLDGRPWTLPTHSAAALATLPWLAVGTQRHACEQLEETSRGLGTEPVLGYANVPLGKARLEGHDEVTAETIHYLPFDPIEPRSVEVARGGQRFGRARRTACVRRTGRVPQYGRRGRPQQGPRVPRRCGRAADLFARSVALAGVPAAG